MAGLGVYGDVSEFVFIARKHMLITDEQADGLRSSSGSWEWLEVEESGRVRSWQRYGSTQ